MNGTIALNDVQEEQIQLKRAINNFSSSTKPRKQNKKDEILLLWEHGYNPLNSTQ